MSERGVIGWVVLVIFAAGVLVAGCIALVNKENDGATGGLGRVELVSHEYGDGECWGEECYGSDYSQDYSGRDRNRNRGRNRGAFSPGPFDDSPVDAFNGNVICLPGSTCYSDGRGEQPPPQEEQP